MAIGLCRLAHSNLYVSIAPVFNIGKSTVIEAIQDVVKVLYDQRNHYIKVCYGCRAATVEKPKCHVAKLFVAAKLRSGYTLLID